MATKEKKTTEQRPSGSDEAAGFWGRLNDFGERHAKLIIFLSSALIVLTVIIFAKVFYDRTLAERASRDLNQAETIEQLQKLKEKYKDTPVAAEIVYRLANRYCEEGKLEEAEKEYTEFKSRFPNHPLKFFVDKAYTSLIANRKFLKEDKDLRLKIRTLQTHPEDRAKARQLLELIPEAQRKVLEEKTSSLFLGPVRLPNPEIHVEITGKGTFWVELFEDEAPNTVYNFLKLIEEKAFQGLKFQKGNETLKVSKPVPYTLGFEKNEREAKQYSLAVRKTPGRDYVPGAEFEILLRDTPGQPDLMVFGEVKAYVNVVQKAAAEDAIQTLTVKSKRETSYVPKRDLRNPEMDFSIAVARGSFTVEFFEDEAPNTVANFVKLVEEKTFDGIKFAKEGERLKLSKAVDFSVPFEKTSRAAKQWMLIARKTAGREDVAGASFEILLQDQPDLKDVVVFGRVANSHPFVGTLGSDDAVQGVTIVYKRETQYEPKRVKP